MDFIGPLKTKKSGRALISKVLPDFIGFYWMVELAEDATPFANFSLIFGDFIYMGSEAISNIPLSSQFDID